MHGWAWCSDVECRDVQVQFLPALLSRSAWLIPGLVFGVRRQAGASAAAPGAFVPGQTVDWTVGDDGRGG